MKAVLLGATRGMGRAIARRMAARGDRLFLLGHLPAELQRSAQDLMSREATQPVGTAHCDLLRPETFAPALAKAQEELGGVDTVVVTAGLFAPQTCLENDPVLAARLLAADFTNTVLFCELSRTRLLCGGGTLCVFSSVAGERGRKPVLLYGSAKAGLSRYMEGLDHKFRSQGLITVCVKPGFVKTGMTAGMNAPPFAGEPDSAARQVLIAIDRGTPEVYVPAAWRWAMWVIRNLPRQVMRRVDF